MYLDYSLKTAEERLAHINKIIQDTPSKQLTSQYKKYMADYLLFITERNQTKKEKKESHSILTRNREATINKRQISFEHITSTLENGEDGIYAMINDDKNQFLDNKDHITKEDIDSIPGLKAQYALISTLKQAFETATGQKRFALKKQIIETWQQIYILRASARGNSSKGKPPTQIKTMLSASIPEQIIINKDGTLTVNSPISILKPEHVSFLLCYYSQLKQDCFTNFTCDMYWLLIDLENLIEKTFKKDSVFFDLILWKIDGITNEEIQKRMLDKYNIVHNEQYYSTLWRKRIPKLIAEQAQKDYLIWYYSTQEYGDWKYCRKCGEYKLAHPMFFTKNTSKSGWYSVCKDCRKRKRLGKDIKQGDDSNE